MYNVLSMLWEQETVKRYHMALPHDVYSGIGEIISTFADEDEDVEHSSRSSSLRFPGGYEHHTEYDDVAECQQDICVSKNSSSSNEVVVPENKDAEPRLKVRYYYLNVKACDDVLL